MSKTSYKMPQPHFLSEVMARTIAQSFKCEWHLNEIPGGDPWGEYLLVRDGEMKAVLRTFPDRIVPATEEHYLSLEEVNRVATTFRALGLKLLVARPTVGEGLSEGAIGIATLDGSTIDRVHVWRTSKHELRTGWIIDSVEFRRTINLPDGKRWADLKTAGGDNA